MIAELAAAALGGMLAAGTGWFLDRQREAAKLARTRRFLIRAIVDDLTYSLQIYDKLSEEFQKTQTVWFNTLNELKQSRQPYFNSKDWLVMLEDEKLRREIFRYYLESTDKITVLENAQTRIYALERTYNDLKRQILVNEPSATPDTADARAIHAMSSENQEYLGLRANMKDHVSRLVGLKTTAQTLISRLQSGNAKT